MVIARDPRVLAEGTSTLNEKPLLKLAISPLQALTISTLSVEVSLIPPLGSYRQHALSPPSIPPIINTFSVSVISFPLPALGSHRQHALYIWDKATGSLVKMLTGQKGETLLDIVVGRAPPYCHCTFSLTCTRTYLHSVYTG